MMSNYDYRRGNVLPTCDHIAVGSQVYRKHVVFHEMLLSHHEYERLYYACEICANRELSVKDLETIREFEGYEPKLDQYGRPVIRNTEKAEWKSEQYEG